MRSDGARVHRARRLQVARDDRSDVRPPAVPERRGVTRTPAADAGEYVIRLREGADQVHGTALALARRQTRDCEHVPAQRDRCHARHVRAGCARAYRRCVGRVPRALRYGLPGCSRPVHRWRGRQRRDRRQDRDARGTARAAGVTGSSADLTTIDRELDGAALSQHVEHVGEVARRYRGRPPTSGGSFSTSDP